jgi:serine/threonine protein kinase
MVNHPLITKLHATMQDRKYIYFLMELLPGGEFFNFLQKAGKLSEDKSRFYAASVVLAFEELHRNRIAYRDLKPENMVMDARGYVKLVDFGLAKQLITDSTWTMCGTPDYLAPEIILNKGHNQAVDYWALGVLMFEMIYGWPPFYHDQPMRVYEKIILGKVNYPDTFSKPLEDIVSKFLVTNPSKRLGNMKGGLADVTKHKWFGSFDWQGLGGGTLSAPFVPDLTAFDSALAAAREKPPAGEDDQGLEDCDWMPEL